MAHLLEDYLPIDEPHQRHDRHSDGVVGMERLPVAIDYPDRSIKPDHSFGTVCVQLAVRHELSDGFR